MSFDNLSISHVLAPNYENNLNKWKSVQADLCSPDCFQWILWSSAVDSKKFAVTFFCELFFLDWANFSIEIFFRALPCARPRLNIPSLIVILYIFDHLPICSLRSQAGAGDRNLLDWNSSLSFTLTAGAISKMNKRIHQIYGQYYWFLWSLLRYLKKFAVTFSLAFSLNLFNHFNLSLRRSFCQKMVSFCCIFPVLYSSASLLHIIVARVGG